MPVHGGTSYRRRCSEFLDGHSVKATLREEPGRDPQQLLTTVGLQASALGLLGHVGGDGTTPILDDWVNAC
jgi:hypothetical protein